ncbi:hypothetical protein pb186bvf_018226 [Paramecium bursaria]
MNKFSNANKSLTRYEDTQKQRPGSGQPLPGIRSPLPARKLIHSSVEKPRPVPKQTSEIKPKQESEIKLSVSIKQNQLPLVKSPVKSSTKKPPLQKILIVPQKTIVNPARKIRGGSGQRLIESVPKIKNQIPQNFNWENRIISSGEVKGKRRMKSHDNFIDFTMTTKKGELEQILQIYRDAKNINDSSSHQSYQGVLNMSEIMEQSEDNLSSLAQSNAFKRKF